MTKKVIALMLACLTAATLLAGCGKENKPQEEQYMFLPTYHELKDENGNPFANGINSMTVCGDRAYFYTYINYDNSAVTHDTPATVEGTAEPAEDELVDDNVLPDEPIDEPVDGGSSLAQIGFYSVKLDGTDLVRLKDYQMPQVDAGMEGSSGLNAIQSGPDGSILVLESVDQYYYDLPENFNPETDNRWDYYKDGGSKCLLRKLSETGAEVSSVDLKALYFQSQGLDASQEGDNYFWAYSFRVDGSGNAYVSAMGYLMVVAPDGRLLSCQSQDNMNDMLVRLSDGRVAVQFWSEGLKAVNTETWAVDGEVPNPENNNNINYYSAGQGDYLYFYGTSSSLYGMKNDGTTEKLLDWLSCDVDTDYMGNLTVLSGEKVVLFETNWSEDVPKCSLVELDRTLVTEENRREELTMAVVDLDWDLRAAIKRFNRSNTQYRIVVKDYSEYNTDDDWTAGRQKLSTEIISGDVPDILACNNLPVRLYGAKGLLEDLTPYIQNDTALGGENGLVKAVVDALRSDDGKLYTITSRFQVQTAIASSKVVGDVTGLTMDEARQAMTKLQDGAMMMGFYTDQTDLLQRLCSNNMAHYVNWETGECSFDSQGFVQLLECVKLAPQEITDDMYNNWQEYGPNTALREGRQLLCQTTVSDWYSMMDVKSYLGDDAQFVGLPDENREGNSFNTYLPLAMSSKSKNKDGVWQFISAYLTDENDYSWGFSIVQSKLDSYLAEARKRQSYTDENGNQVEYPVFSYTGSDGKQVDVYCLEQEDYDALMALFNNTHRMYDYDQAIMEIIKGEADNFLKGSSSAQDVANAIQNRVTLYVNETR